MYPSIHSFDGSRMAVTPKGKDSSGKIAVK